MARAHLFRPVTDEHGDLLYGATVTVRNALLDQPISQPIYAGPLSDAQERPNPFTIDAGYVDIWLDTPERVNLLIESTGRAPISVYLDAFAPAAEVARTLYPLRITNQPAAGQVLLGVDDATAEWGPTPSITPGAVPAHDHDGTGAMSTALGTGTTATGSRATAVGDSAAANADDATAFGYQAIASQAGATAFGSGASGSAQDATAVGAGASATAAGGVAIGRSAAATDVRGTAIGKQAHAGGAASLALGPNSTAGGVDSVAIGNGSQALGDQSVALGHNATAMNQRAVAVGTGASTDADDQIALGAPGSVTVAQDLVVTEGAKIGSATGALGFFGSTGTGKVTITGVVTDPSLAALLAFLDSIGIITDSTTAS